MSLPLTFAGPSVFILIGGDVGYPLEVSVTDPSDANAVWTGIKAACTEFTLADPTADGWATAGCGASVSFYLYEPDNNEWGGVRVFWDDEVFIGDLCGAFSKSEAGTLYLFGVFASILG